jgi:hypothetical protein
MPSVDAPVYRLRGGAVAIDDLPAWTIWSIVTASAVIGSVLVFLLVLVIALLLRRLTGVREPPALVIVAAREIGGYLRRGLFPRAPIQRLSLSIPAGCSAGIVTTADVILTRWAADI